MKVFFDTSAFAKRYIAENGSGKVHALLATADSLVVSVICLPEIISTLARLTREGKLTPAQYKRLKTNVISDLGDADICEITTDVMNHVIRLLESHPLRAMDAIHLACALAYQPDVFVSADHRQIAVAKRVRVQAIDVSQDATAC